MHDFILNNNTGTLVSKKVSLFCSIGAFSILSIYIVLTLKLHLQLNYIGDNDPNVNMNLVGSNNIKCDDTL